MSPPDTEDRGLTEIRAGLLRQPGLVGIDLRSALADAYDRWLQELFAGLIAPPGLALIAVGGLGRREPSPHSDLDLVLVHSGKISGLAQFADRLWYPVWDAGVGLDHSVRTPDQALRVAKDDLKALLGLLDLRHIAGDAGVVGQLRTRLLDAWRTGAQRRVPELAELANARWKLAGEAAFLLEPNLKESRGALRDAQALHALALAQLVDVPVAVREANTLLLDIRGELHRNTGRADDVLHAQEQSGVAKALDLGEADDLLRAVSEAGRTIAFATDQAFRRIGTGGESPSLRSRLLRRGTSPADRVPLAKDVVSQGGEVVLARDADPWADPLLPLRAARAAAENTLPLAPYALERLATEAQPMPEPWPPAAVDEFVTLLGQGEAAIPVLEALDLAGLLVRLIPEWDLVRFTAQHNPVHRFTVDRHLMETAAQAAALTRDVARPDLLLLSALFHDIGKGRGLCADLTQHPEAGAVVAERIARRIGLVPADVATITALVRHHLLLADTAVRRDLDDPVTVRTVADALGGSTELLDLLHAVTIADALATGSHVWSDWKSGLVADLVDRTRRLMAGAPLPPLPPLEERRRVLAEVGRLAVEIAADEVVVAVPDGIGVLSRTAGVLALHSLDVRAASIATHAGMAVNSFLVDPRFGSMPDAAVVREDLARALSGSLPLADKLAAKERAYARNRPTGRLSRPPTVHWFDDAATDATVLELRADDAIGLLYRVTAALERCGVDISSARLSSLGGSVVDAFYVRTVQGKSVPPAVRERVEAALAEL